MENLTQLLSMLAAKLGTTVEYLWTVLIKQAAISGVQNLIWGIICIVPIILWVYYFRYFLKNKEEIKRKYDDELHIIGLSVSLIVSLVFLALFAECINTAITAFINPEYWALKEILSQLKNN